MPSPDEDRLQQTMNAANGNAESKPVITSNSAIPPRRTKPGIGNVAAGVSPNARQQASKQVVINDAFDYDVAFKLAFIGAGQGGGRIANAFHSLGYRRVAAFNLTDSDFEGLDPSILKHALDVGGAAKDTEQARKALQGREEEVWDLMTRAWGNDPDYALVCVGLGGGTGSGTAEQLIQSARKYMESKGKLPRVGAIVSLPTVTEGQQVCLNALKTFKKLLDLKVSPLLIIDNTRIHEIFKPGMSQLHDTANETISQLFHLFNRLAAVHSKYITFDRAEFGQLLDNGISVLGAASVGGLQDINSPADISETIREELSNNVLAEVDLKRGTKGACLFVGGEEELSNLSLDFFEAGFNYLDHLLGSGYAADSGVVPVLHRGLYVGSEPELQVYTMVSGLEPPTTRLAALAKKAGAMDQLQTPMSFAKFFNVND